MALTKKMVNTYAHRKVTLRIDIK